MRRKKRDFEAEIAIVKEKIKKAETKVKDLQQQLRSLNQERNAEAHQALTEVMDEKNLTIEDVLALVKDTTAKEGKTSKGRGARGK